MRKANLDVYPLYNRSCTEYPVHVDTVGKALQCVRNTIRKQYKRKDAIKVRIEQSRVRWDYDGGIQHLVYVLYPDDVWYFVGFFMEYEVQE
jgi:hypothetical protein